MGPLRSFISSSFKKFNATHGVFYAHEAFALPQRGICRMLPKKLSTTDAHIRTRSSVHYKTCNTVKMLGHESSKLPSPAAFGENSEFYVSPLMPLFWATYCQYYRHGFFYDSVDVVLVIP